MNKLLLIIVGMLAFSCKTTKATKYRTSQPHSALDGSKIKFSKKSDPNNVIVVDDVPLSQLGQLIVYIDLSDCVGTGKWLDPARPASPKIGAVALNIVSEETGELTSSLSRFTFEPSVDSADNNAIEALTQYSWRLKHGRYHLKSWVIEGRKTKVGDDVSSPVATLDAEAEKALTVTGAWDASLGCRLNWTP